MVELIGVTYQQAHKYERGINRISAGRLFEIAQVLRVPVGYFFEGLGDWDDADLSTRQRMCLEVARNFAQIENERRQDRYQTLRRNPCENECLPHRAQTLHRASSKTTRRLETPPATVIKRCWFLLPRFPASPIALLPGYQFATF